MIPPIPVLLLVSVALLLAGCGGGSDVTADSRITRCLDQQPDATKSDCSEWEDAGELADDGTHAGHENM